MTEKRVAKLLGGYERTIYPTALGEMWAMSNINGPQVKVLGPLECVHYISAQEARDAAAALVEIADAIDAGGNPPA